MGPASVNRDGFEEGKRFEQNQPFPAGGGGQPASSRTRPVGAPMIALRAVWRGRAGSEQSSRRMARSATAKYSPELMALT